MAEQTNANNQEVQQDLSEILKVRREKLRTLQEEGRDPFQQTKFVVSHHAQEIKDNFDELGFNCVELDPNDPSSWEQAFAPHHDLLHK